MAPVAVVDKSSKPSLSQGEVEVILNRAGIKENHPDAFQGRGGILIVVSVAVFSSLAGLLMGLDIGYIAGVKTMDSFSRGLLHQEELRDTQDSIITMIFGVGAAIAAFPPVMDFCVGLLGRKGAVIFGGFIFCLGATIQSLAINMCMMLVGRIIAGFSVGLLSGNAPVYTSEIAPPKLRGALVTGFQFAITIGIMIAFVLSLVLENVEKPYGGWRWVITAQIVPGALLVLGGVFMPGSPRYLVAQGKPQEALKALLLLRSQDVREELAEVCQEHEVESATQGTWREFLSGDNLKLLGIGISIQLLQQLCGMNAFMYNGPLIFEKLFGNEHAGILFTLVSGVVNIFATIPGLFLVDRYGRSKLMKWSAIGMMFCSAVLATVGDICFQEDGTGRCGDWAKWTATVAICGFILNFAYGWGGMTWVYCAEMFPQKHRTKGVAATTDACWVGNILIAFLPPLMFANWGFNTFWFFVGTNCLCLFCAMSLPETKDKSLEEITVMFNQWFHPDLIFWTKPSRTLLALVLWNLGAKYCLRHYPAFFPLGLFCFMVSHYFHGDNDQAQTGHSTKRPTLVRKRTAPAILEDSQEDNQHSALTRQDSRHVDYDEAQLGSAVQKLCFVLPGSVKDTCRGLQPLLRTAADAVQMIHDIFVWDHDASPVVAIALLLWAVLSEVLRFDILLMLMGSSILLACSPLLPALSGFTAYISLLRAKAQPKEWEMRDEYEEEWLSKDYLDVKGLVNTSVSPRQRLRHGKTMPLLTKAPETSGA